MLNFPATTVSVIIPRLRFEEVNQLLQTMAKSSEEVILAEDLLLSSDRSFQGLEENFTLVASEEFTAIFWGRLIENSSTDVSINHNNLSNYQNNGNDKRVNADLVVVNRPESSEKISNKVSVGLSFDGVAIASFLLQLSKQSQLSLNLEKKISILVAKIARISSKNLTMQSEFTLKLMALLIANPEKQNLLPKNGDVINGNLNTNGHNNNLKTDKKSLEVQEQVWQQQIEKEQLLETVSSQISKSFELPVMVSRSLEKCRSVLDVDRLVVLALVDSSFETNKSSHAFPKIRVIDEAIASQKIKSIWGLNEEDKYFFKVENYQEKYSKTFVKAIEDVEESYSCFPGLLKVMQQHNVRAKLVAPIIVANEFWGLLIAHHSSKRQWQESDKKVMGQMAENLAIAIYQAQIYGELKQQKQILEKQVIEATQNLYDALQATELANCFKTQFLATISHELRTPLTSIIGISSTLLRFAFSGTNLTPISREKQKYYLETIYNSGKELLLLINNILDMSQIESGMNMLKRSKFSLAEIVDFALNNVKEEARKKEITLIKENYISDREDEWIADEKRIKKILLNLLSNAIKFTPSGGKIILRLWLEKNTVIFEVEDTGIGISESQRSLLFETFKQLDASYDRLYGGTGLGLALTKQLVEMQGGIIEVESTVNVGSTFRVRIPSINK